MKTSKTVRKKKKEEKKVITFQSQIKIFFLSLDIMENHHSANIKNAS